MKFPVIPYPNHLQEQEGFFQGDITAIEESLESGLPEGPEGYVLEITKEKIFLRAQNEKGLFYGRQTLRQMQSSDGGQGVPCCLVRDRPAFSHRGFMLDCVRHFFSVRDLEKMIDLCAQLKLNTFHWHLTDDQGWRIEIDQYPDLIKKGCTRPYSDFGRYYEPGVYAGYYSKEQIRHIVDFCAQRQINVIPEIEMPGHASALLAAYPQFSCDGKPVQVKTRGGVYHDTLCPGKEETYEMLERVLAEVIDLFPYSKIHLGGDEAPKDHWKECEHCQRRMKQEGLKNEAELQGYFTNRIAAFLKEKGRTAVVWNDALKGGNLNPEIQIQYWIGEWEPTVQQVEAGASMIQSDYYHYYMDYSHGQTPLNKVYEYDPVPESLRPESRTRVLGIEAPVWTEYMPDLKSVAYMCFPRLAAAAESGWTRPEQKNPEQFQNRFLQWGKQLADLGLKPAPQKLWNMKKYPRIWDALKFWYHALTWKDFREFVQRLREEKEEEENKQ